MSVNSDRDRTPAEVRMGPLIAAGRFLELPQWWTHEGVEQNDFAVSIHASWDESRFTYRAEKVEVTGRGDQPVTSTILRSIPVSRLVESVNRVVLELGMRVEDEAIEEATESIRKAAREERGPTPRALEAMAKLYEMAVASGSAPVKRIQEIFELPNRTATHWVKLARDRDHIDPRVYNAFAVDAPRKNAGR